MSDDQSTERRNCDFVSLNTVLIYIKFNRVLIGRTESVMNFENESSGKVGGTLKKAAKNVES